MDPSLYLVETFTPHIGSAFKATTASGEGLELELVEVQPGPTSPHSLQFALLFRGPLAPVLSQRIYRIEHARLGEMDLFLVPVAREPQAMMYQVVFNRFREAQPAPHP
jgi:hypothetical protein